MAEAATSAAEPWMGVLMAARSACPCLREVERSRAERPSLKRALKGRMKRKQYALRHELQSCPETAHSFHPVHLAIGNHTNRPNQATHFLLSPATRSGSGRVRPSSVDTKGATL